MTPLERKRDLVSCLVDKIVDAIENKPTEKRKEIEVMINNLGIIIIDELANVAQICERTTNHATEILRELTEDKHND